MLDVGFEESGKESSKTGPNSHRLVTNRLVTGVCSPGDGGSERHRETQAKG
jgi:hypothetical protein